MTLNMRPSRVLKKLRAGEMATCVKTNLADARSVEIAAQSGFDCVWVDLEHVPNDYHDIESCVWAAKTHDMDILTRVARGGYSDYIKPLELDAAGIMVPHIMNLADAQNVARMTRFHPIGLRPIDGGNADGAYCAIPTAAYVRQANEQRFVVVQIEDVEPMEEIEEIAKVPGIDMLFFGPGDFSHSVGAPGELNHPRVVEARKRVAEVALANGKFAGTVGSLANLDSLLDMGYRFVNIGSDVVALSRYYVHTVQGIRDVLENRSKGDTNEKPNAHGSSSDIYT